MTTVAIVCSPNMGIADSWLPVVAALREEHPDWRLVAVVPRGWGVGIRPESVALRALGGLVDAVAIEVMPGVYRRVADFHSADQVRARYVVGAERIQQLNVRLSRRAPVLARALAACVRIVAAFLPGGTRERWATAEGWSLALVDAVVLDRVEIGALMRALGDPPCFSLPHGLGFLDPDEVERSGGEDAGERRAEGDARRQTSVQWAYAYSPQHRRRLMHDHGLSETSVRVTGVPRHDPEGPSVVVGASGEALSAEWEGAVLLISRPSTSAGETPTSSTDWLPAGRKAAQLRAIHRVVCVERGLRLVVTMHPKERDDLAIREGLPEGEIGSTWMMTEAHPLALAPQLNFAISFSSGVAVDLLSVGVPTIEFQDARGVSAFDRADAARDAQGRILRTTERRSALVLPADDEQDLRAQVQRISEERDQVLTALRDAYRSRYADPRGAVRRIVLDVEAAVSGRAPAGMPEADH